MGIKFRIKVALFPERCENHICICDTSSEIMHFLCGFWFLCSVGSIFCWKGDRSEALSANQEGPKWLEPHFSHVLCICRRAHIRRRDRDDADRRFVIVDVGDLTALRELPRGVSALFYHCKLKVAFYLSNATSSWKLKKERSAWKAKVIWDYIFHAFFHGFETAM